MDTKFAGPDDPVLAGFRQILLHVAGRIQPNQPSYEAAQRILDAVENIKPMI